MKTLAVIICLFSSLTVSSQNLEYINSLKRFLENKGNEVSKVAALKLICKYYQYKNTDSTIKYARKLEISGE